MAVVRSVEGADAGHPDMIASRPDSEASTGQTPQNGRLWAWPSRRWPPRWQPRRRGWRGWSPARPMRKLSTVSRPACVLRIPKRAPSGECGLEDLNLHGHAPCAPAFAGAFERLNRKGPHCRRSLNLPRQHRRRKRGHTEPAQVDLGGGSRMVAERRGAQTSPLNRAKSTPNMTSTKDAPFAFGEGLEWLQRGFVADGRQQPRCPSSDVPFV